MIDPQRPSNDLLQHGDRSGVIREILDHEGLKQAHMDVILEYDARDMATTSEFVQLRQDFLEQGERNGRFMTSGYIHFQQAWTALSLELGISKARQFACLRRRPCFKWKLCEYQHDPDAISVEASGTSLSEEGTEHPPRGESRVNLDEMSSFCRHLVKRMDKEKRKLDRAKARKQDKEDAVPDAVPPSEEGSRTHSGTQDVQSGAANRDDVPVSQQRLCELPPANLSAVYLG